MSKVTSKNFTPRLTKTCSAFGAIRDELNALLGYALAQYSEGNFTYITEIVNVKTLKGIAMNSIVTFITAHADVKLDKDATSGVYKFISRKTRGFKYAAPTVTWFEHNSDGEAVVIVPMKRLEAFIKSMEKALTSSGKTTVAKKDRKSGIKIVAGLKALTA
jgi:hypothetical protein